MNQKHRNMAIIFGMSLLLAGCQMRGDSFAGEEITTMEIMTYTTSEIDFDEITNLFWGMSAEEAEEYIPGYLAGTESLHYEKDNIEMCYYPDIFPMQQAIAYSDNNYGMASCYSHIWDTKMYLVETMGSWLRDVYPFEELESCSKEEVIEFCEPYAKALGYADADVTVYALREEELDKAAEERGGILNGGSAPDPDYEWITDGEFWQAKEDGASQEELNQMIGIPPEEWFRGIEWTEEHEALMVVYRPYFNGKIIEDMNQRLEILYVPALEKIVCLSAAMPFEEDEVVEEVEVVTEEQAIEKALSHLSMKLTGEIVIENISMVYNTDPYTSTAYPRWRIEYSSDEEETKIGFNGTLLINAVTGNVYSNGIKQPFE